MNWDGGNPGYLTKLVDLQGTINAACILLFTEQRTNPIYFFGITNWSLIFKHSLIIFEKAQIYVCKVTCNINIPNHKYATIYIEL